MLPKRGSNWQFTAFKNKLTWNAWERPSEICLKFVSMGEPTFFYIDLVLDVVIVSKLQLKNYVLDGWNANFTSILAGELILTFGRPKNQIEQIDGKFPNTSPKKSLTPEKFLF